MRPDHLRVVPEVEGVRIRVSDKIYKKTWLSADPLVAVDIDEDAWKQQ